MRKVRRKKITPRLCSLGSTVWEQEKHLSNKKHINHKHDLTGEEIQLHQAAIRSRSNSRRWPQTRLSGWRFKSERRRRGMGGGEVCVCVVVYINVCRMGEEARASHCSALPRGNFSSSDLAKATVRGSQKRQDCFVLGRVTAFQFHGYFFVHSGLQYRQFSSKAVSFSMIESILRLIVSVSMLTEQYICEFMMPSMKCSSPTPAALMQPHIRTLPPPCFTVGTMHFILYSSPLRHHTVLKPSVQKHLSWSHHSRV